MFHALELQLLFQRTPLGVALFEQYLKTMLFKQTNLPTEFFAHELSHQMNGPRLPGSKPQAKVLMFTKPNSLSGKTSLSTRTLLAKSSHPSRIKAREANALSKLARERAPSPRSSCPWSAASFPAVSFAATSTQTPSAPDCRTVHAFNQTRPCER